MSGSESESSASSKDDNSEMYKRVTVGYKKVNNKSSRTNYLDLLVGHLL